VPEGLGLVKRFALYLIIYVAGMIVDQEVKGWVRRSISVGESLDGKPWPGVFEITHTENYGIAFGLLQGFGASVLPIAIAIAIFATYFSFRSPKEPVSFHVALALLASGAVGNMLDRAAFGKVTDMFRIRVIDFPVFNVADILITVAACMLIVKWSLESIRQPATSPRAGETSADSDTEPSDKSSAST
jgi:signal peptidase II